MFDKIQGMKEWFQTLQQLMKDENFRAFLSHPRVQELLKDPEFLEILKTKDQTKLATHPKFAFLSRDPEIASLIAKLVSSRGR